MAWPFPKEYPEYTSLFDEAADRMVRDLPTDREGLTAYLKGLLEQKKAEVERMTIDPDDSDEEDDLVSSPSAKRRRIDPEEVGAKTVKGPGPDSVLVSPTLLSKVVRNVRSPDDSARSPMF